MPPSSRPFCSACSLATPAGLASALSRLSGARVHSSGGALLDFCLLAAHSAPLRRDWGSGHGCAACLVSRHYGHSGPASVHGMGGGAYILGKLFWSFFKNVLGLPAVEQYAAGVQPCLGQGAPPRSHLGAIQLVGVCQPSLWGPGRLLLAWFGIFGIGPALAVALWRRMVPALSGQGRDSRRLTPGMVIVFRFCIVYGVISILMTPLLGASADRLVEYGWPFYFVVLPWFSSLSLRPPRFPLRLDPSASPAYLLAGLVWLPSADPRLPARRSSRAGFEWVATPWSGGLVGFPEGYALR